jgi:hypothetical protein
MTPAHPLPVALAALVSVIVDGALVPSAPAAALRDGRVVAPVALVARIADRIDVGTDGRIWARRGERTCSARPAPPDDPALLAIGPLARCLGARVEWDGRTKTLSLTFAGPLMVSTPRPYDPNAPRVAPTTVFTPEPAPPTPRVIVTGSPQPRRTPIPVTPSWPLTSPRP